MDKQKQETTKRAEQFQKEACELAKENQMGNEQEMNLQKVLKPEKLDI